MVHGASIRHHTYDSLVIPAPGGHDQQDSDSSFVAPMAPGQGSHSCAPRLLVLCAQIHLHGKSGGPPPKELQRNPLTERDIDRPVSGQGVRGIHRAAQPWMSFKTGHDERGWPTTAPLLPLAGPDIQDCTGERLHGSCTTARTRHCPQAYVGSQIIDGDPWPTSAPSPRPSLGCRMVQVTPPQRRRGGGLTPGLACAADELGAWPWDLLLRVASVCRGDVLAHR